MNEIKGQFISTGQFESLESTRVRGSDSGLGRLRFEPVFSLSIHILRGNLTVAPEHTEGTTVYLSYLTH